MCPPEAYRVLRVLRNKREVSITVSQEYCRLTDWYLFICS